MSRKIAILGTGGTIAGQGSSAGGSTGYQAGQIGIAQLLLPVLDHALPGAWALEVEQLMQLDSKDMDVASWQSMAQACQRWMERSECAAVVLTHGTDTLEESAWFLQCVLQPSKPVVLTCAMRPADALSADGPANLRDAVAAATQLGAGVWVVAAGEVHRAQQVRKVHPYRLHAFDGAGVGPAAWIEEGRVRWAGAQPPKGALQAAPLEAVIWQTAPAQWPWVEVVTSTAAARAETLEALVEAGVQGLVVACTGNGSIHRAWQPALQRARERGVRVWRSTRCEQGHIVLGPQEHCAETVALSPVKARISLMLQLLAESA